MRGIKHVLTERHYAYEEARRLAATDPDIDLNPGPDEAAYKVCNARNYQVNHDRLTVIGGDVHR